MGVRFTVAVDCPTPLAHNPLTVSADSEELAWKEFCRLNGISGTDRQVTITRYHAAD